ncbi:hypothetical protein BVC80_8923g33 [Macleaya cordata]|uniref:Uncharacterized protein n=1 Tax=Macleaya cordata TaxID=56857 RepID=A0A200PVJ5_MACCD|nr:hypothetical protein BVC80_8923g33 [Macleaya cordata]
MDEEDVEEMKYARERKPLNSKKVTESETDDDDTGEEDVVEITRAKERKTLNSKKAKKCDTNDDAKTKKPTKPVKDTNGSASQSLRQTRSSKRIAKDDDKEVSKLVEVTENNVVSISQELLPECGSIKQVIKESDIKGEEVKEEAVGVVKEDHGPVSTKPQTEVESKKLFRKNSSSTKLFRKKSRYC